MYSHCVGMNVCICNVWMIMEHVIAVSKTFIYYVQLLSICAYIFFHRLFVHCTEPTKMVLLMIYFLLLFFILFFFCRKDYTQAYYTKDTMKRKRNSIQNTVQIDKKRKILKFLWTTDWWGIRKFLCSFTLNYLSFIV